MSRIFGKVCQNGYVVRDIEASMRHWTEVMGVGPFFYLETVDIENFQCRGVAGKPDVSIALANTGDLQIELIQQHCDTPTMYREFLEAGHEGLQHMSYWSTDYQADHARFLDLGYKVGQEGEIGDNGEFCYFDTQTHPGTVVEISNIAGEKGSFFDYIKRKAYEWDGSEPIRYLGR